jgi:hypothetical protein
MSDVYEPIVCHLTLIFAPLRGREQQKAINVEVHVEIGSTPTRIGERAV